MRVTIIHPIDAIGIATSVEIHGTIIPPCELHASIAKPATIDPREAPVADAVGSHDNPSVSECSGIVSLTIRFPVAKIGETHSPLKSSKMLRSTSLSKLMFIRIKPIVRRLKNTIR